MFDKMQTNNCSLSKNVTTNEKQMLIKIGLKFHKIAFYVYFDISDLELRGHKGPKRSLWNKN